jgi:hypothetical protein
MGKGASYGVDQAPALFCFGVFQDAMQIDYKIFSCTSSYQILITTADIRSYQFVNNAMIAFSTAGTNQFWEIDVLNFHYAGSLLFAMVPPF